MRRGLPVALALLLAALLAAPLAEAGHDKGKEGGRVTPSETTKAPAAPPPSSDDEDEDERPAAPAPARKAVKGSSAPLERISRALGDVPTPIGLGLASALGVVLLGLAFLAARRAFRPPPPKPPRKSFAAGRARGVREGMVGARAALAALERSGLGELATVGPHGAGYRVALRRARGVPCEHAAGYLTGLFEGAWAVDVRLEHPVCAGKEKGAACVYEAYPAPPPVPRAPEAPIRSGGRGEAASIRG